MNRFLRKLFWVMVFMVIAVLLYGCDQQQGRMSSGDGIVISEQLSKEQLRSALDNYEEFFVATIKNVSDELDELMPNTRNYKKTLHLRDRTIGACRTMLEQDDPQVAFVDSWVLAVRLAEYFKSGQGSDLFGKYQSLVTDATGQIQEHIERIGKEFLDTKTFIMTRDKVYEFSRSRPISKKYAESIVFATEGQRGQPSPFIDIVSLPLAPIKIVGGVTQGVSGVNKLSGSADHFSDVVEGLPESARWQLLLLLYEMEKTDSVKSALASMNEFSNSSSRLADSAEKLPEQLRQEISTLIEDIDTKQTNLQNTIAQLHALVAEVDDLTRNINWRAAQLILFVFILALAYRLVIVRFINKPK